MSAETVNNSTIKRNAFICTATPGPLPERKFCCWLLCSVTHCGGLVSYRRLHPDTAPDDELPLPNVLCRYIYQRCGLFGQTSSELSRAAEVHREAATCQGRVRSTEGGEEKREEFTTGNSIPFQ